MTEQGLKPRTETQAALLRCIQAQYQTVIYYQNKRQEQAQQTQADTTTPTSAPDTVDVSSTSSTPDPNLFFSLPSSPSTTASTSAYIIPTSSDGLPLDLTPIQTALQHHFIQLCNQFMIHATSHIYLHSADKIVHIKTFNAALYTILTWNITYAWYMYDEAINRNLPVDAFTYAIMLAGVSSYDVHKAIDLLQLYIQQQKLVSFPAVYRLMRACVRYELNAPDTDSSRISASTSSSSTLASVLASASSLSLSGSSPCLRLRTILSSSIPIHWHLSTAVLGAQLATGEAILTNATGDVIVSQHSSLHIPLASTSSSTSSKSTSASSPSSHADISYRAGIIWRAENQALRVIPIRLKYFLSNVSVKRIPVYQAIELEWCAGIGT